jgi:hypothetical protein
MLIGWRRWLDRNTIQFFPIVNLVILAALPIINATTVLGTVQMPPPATLKTT